MNAFANIIPVVPILSCLVCVGCAESSTEPDTEACQWISGVSFYSLDPDPVEEIEHDNRILECDNCLIFSHASSD